MQKIADSQDAYIRDQDMLVIDGYIGNDSEHRVAARLFIEAANANIAGMQRWLYFEAENPGPDFEPVLTVIYTPNLDAPGYPNDRVIAVDLEAGVTRVLNSDYFGESKKGGLRMWNKLTYDEGGLALHAGCKVVPTARGEQALLIIGLSGTGKTTTTFTRQNDSKPGAGRFRRAVSRGAHRRHGERLLREDVRAGSRGRAHHLRRRLQARDVPRERVAG